MLELWGCLGGLLCLAALIYCLFLDNRLAQRLNEKSPVEIELSIYARVDTLESEVRRLKYQMVGLVEVASRININVKGKKVKVNG